MRFSKHIHIITTAAKVVVVLYLRIHYTNPVGRKGDGKSNCIGSQEAVPQKFCEVHAEVTESVEPNKEDQLQQALDEGQSDFVLVFEYF